MKDHLVVVGDALLDRDVDGTVNRICPDAPVPVLDQSGCRSMPGGAGLAASFLASDGRPVTLITALSRDAAAGEFSRQIIRLGVDLFDIGQDGETPEKIRYRCGQTLLRVDRGQHGKIRSAGLAPTLESIMAGAAAVLVSDYGQGITASPEVRTALEKTARSRPVVWDPHPRGTLPVRGVRIVKLNLKEAVHFAAYSDVHRPESDPLGLCRLLLDDWQADAVCITRGEEPVALVERDSRSHTVPVAGANGDVCGAGDRFASSLLRELSLGTDIPTAVRTAATDASTYVVRGERPSGPRQARQPQATGIRRARVPRLRDAAEDVIRTIDTVREAGGVIVATGGCFDLLHAGHVRAIEAAARLGDHLLVLINSDRSVRAIKGPDRPLVAEDERALLVSSLACVDSVLVFDQRTPIDALQLIKPDVWAKGGDYEAGELPERDAIAAWGGRIAILPFVEERSTTRLIEEAGALGRQ